jgi:hypothetical protein
MPDPGAWSNHKRLRDLATILHAFDPRDWDMDTLEVLDCVERLRGVGLQLCPWHFPMGVPGALIDIAPEHGVEFAEVRSKNGVVTERWCWSWTRWVLVQLSEVHVGRIPLPWTLKRKGHVALLGEGVVQARSTSAIPAVSDGLLAALCAAMRLGGTKACEDFLWDNHLCTCKEVHY